MNGNLMLDELYEIANELSVDHWGVPFDARIELVNRKWRSMNGCFMYNKKTGEQLIRLSRKVNALRTRDEVIGTLLHELVHWRLHNEGKPNKDTDFEFVAECLRVGAPISMAGNAQKAYERYVREINGGTELIACGN